MSSSPFILKENFQITSADTDFSKTLKPSALINMLIQAAWHHAEILEFGVDMMHRENLIWMLSRIQTRIFLHPFWNDNLSIITWPKGVRKLFYLRDFEVYDSLNRLVAQTTSEWILIDVKAKRPKLYNPENNIFNQNKDKHALKDAVSVLDEINTDAESFSNQVKYSDIDLNQHLTTTRYIDWMMDTFSMDFHNTNKCKALILNFIREVPYNEKVDIHRRKDNSTNCFLFGFKKSDEKKDLFRGQLCF
jgi:medium-chain acyl-[acyl-carrier-protein] hydrolase